MTHLEIAYEFAKGINVDDRFAEICNIRGDLDRC
jgi:hypothetical protein